MLIEFTFFSCAKSMFYDIDSIIVLLKKYKNKIVFSVVERIYVNLRSVALNSLFVTYTFITACHCLEAVTYLR